METIRNTRRERIGVVVSNSMEKSNCDYGKSKGEASYLR